MPMTVKTAANFPSPSMTGAVPGQEPVRPQPVPSNSAPLTSRGRMALPSNVRSSLPISERIRNRFMMKMPAMPVPTALAMTQQLQVLKQEQLGVEIKVRGAGPAQQKTEQRPEDQK